MPQLDDLNLNEESVPEVDWDAPESGAFPPSVPPGVHDFTFKLGDDPWDAFEKDGKRYLQVTYGAVTTVEGTERTLNFQRASTFLNDAMRKAGMNHMVGELLRSLGFKISGPLTKEAIADALTQANAEGKHFRGEVGWRRYCKPCDQTVSTQPRKKKGDVAWPRGANGFELVVACPKCGDKAYGNAEITRFKLPEAVSTVASTTGTHGVSV